MGIWLKIKYFLPFYFKPFWFKWVLNLIKGVFNN